MYAKAVTFKALCNPAWEKRIQPYEEYRNVDAFERNCVFIAVYLLTVYIF